MTDPYARPAEPERPTLGVVVVNYASHELIRDNLGPVPLADVEVVVVDNFSTAEERQAVRALTVEHGWTLVAREDNGGFGVGVNAGVAEAERLGCVGYLLLNPDVVISAAVLEELRLCLVDDPSALVSPALTDPAGAAVSAEFSLDLVDGRNRSAQAVREDPSRQRRPITWLTAACLAVPAPVWLRSGGMAEDYFMYWEDVDFAFRARAVGAEMVLRRDLTAVHDQGGTQGPRQGRAKSALYYYYNCRNRLRFAVRNLPRRTVLGWLLRTPVVSWEILLRGGRRQLLDSPGLGWAAVRGMVAGLLEVVVALSRPDRSHR